MNITLNSFLAATLFLLLCGCSADRITKTNVNPEPNLSAKTSQDAARFDWFRYEGDDQSQKVKIDPETEFRNPILSGFYPDPSITQVGSSYYLVNSTFTYFPGLPVFQSQDLVNWTQIGNVIDRPGMLDFDGLGLSRGVFAPTIEHHQGVFYVANTCVDCGGNFIVTAQDPAGPWSDPIWLPEIGGIDPSLFFDTDGTVYIINNDAPPGEALYEGHRALWMRAVDPETFQSISKPKVILNGGVRPEEKPIWIEGPHIYFKDGWYYLSAAEGGTAVDHSQVILRSRDVQGPYTPYENNPIMTHRHLDPDRENPITSIGHADYVKDGNEDWWATFLGVRPYEGDYYNTGRETFLMPVQWENGWPIILKGDKKVFYAGERPALKNAGAPPIPMSGNFVVLDTFNEQALPPYWMTPRIPKSDWYRLQEGALEIDFRSEGLGTMRQPALMARRQQHISSIAKTKLDRLPSNIQSETGLSVFQSDDYFYAMGLRHDRNGSLTLSLRRKAGEKDTTNGVVIASKPIEYNAPMPIYLKIESEGGRYSFFYSSDDKNWKTLADAQDGKILSTRQAGGFVGAVYGLYVQDPSIEK